MPNKTPEQIAAKYGRRVAAAGQDYQEGVQNPSRDWADSTAGAEERYQAGLQESFGERRFSAGVQRAGSAKWQRNALEKGAQRYTSAAQTAAAAYQQQAQHVMGAADAARNAAERMPGTTYEQRQQKALAAMDATRQYWRRVRGGGG